MNQYYISYILPIFDYGCLLWGRCTAANNNTLIKLQKRATRIVLQADILTPSQTMFKELKWLDFPKRVQYHTCILIHQALNGMAPEYNQELFSKSSEIHNRNLRSVENDMLKIPYSRTCYYERPFAIDGAKQWGHLPLDIKHAPSLSIFKTSMQSHLLAVQLYNFKTISALKIVICLLHVFPKLNIYILRLCG